MLTALVSRLLDPRLRPPIQRAHLVTDPLESKLGRSTVAAPVRGPA